MLQCFDVVWVTESHPAYYKYCQPQITKDWLIWSVYVKMGQVCVYNCVCVCVCVCDHLCCDFLAFTNTDTKHFHAQETKICFQFIALAKRNITGMHKRSGQTAIINGKVWLVGAWHAQRTDQSNATQVHTMHKAGEPNSTGQLCSAATFYCNKSLQSDSLQSKSDHYKMVPIPWKSCLYHMQTKSRENSG